MILLRLTAAQLAQRHTLLHHEARHATQWACFLGLIGFRPPMGSPHYGRWRGAAALHRNVFECRAGLSDGGYRIAARSRRRRDAHERTLG
ncbi:MAG: hypothetical protein ACRC35_08215 [Angustibacter sp.]